MDEEEIESKKRESFLQPVQPDDLLYPFFECPPNEKESKIKNLEARAENYTFERVNEILLQPTHAYNVMREYCIGRKEEDTDSYQTDIPCFSTTKRPLMLIGQRGIGKTFSVIKLIIYLLKNTNYTPKMFIFKKNNMIEEIDVKGTTIYRETRYQMDTEHVNFLPSDIFIYDDIHYLCDSVIDNETDKTVLINLFKEMLDRVHSGKKVILISDATLSYYAEKINDEKFNRLIWKFGDHINKKVGYESYLKMKKEYDYLAKLMFDGPSDTALQNMIEDAGKRTDPLVWYFLSEMERTSRGIVNFLNEFSCKEITYKELFIKAYAIVKNSDLADKDKQIFFRLLAKGKVEVSDSFTKFFKAVKIFGTIDNLKRYIEDFESRKTEILPTLEKEMKRIKTYSHVKKRKQMDRYLEGLTMLLNTWKANTLTDIDYWDMLEEYEALLSILRMESASYQGNYSLFYGWKGNFKPLYNAILKMDKHLIHFLWNNHNLLKLYVVTYEGMGDEVFLYPFEVLRIAFQHCFEDSQYIQHYLEDSQYIDDMLKVSNKVKP